LNRLQRLQVLLQSVDLGLHVADRGAELRGLTDHAGAARGLLHCRAANRDPMSAMSATARRSVTVPQG